MVLTSRFRPHTQHDSSPQASKPHVKERVEALKRKNLKRGERVVVSGSITAEFVRGDLTTGDAYVLVGKREQKVNPLNIEKSTKSK